MIIEADFPAQRRAGKLSVRQRLGSRSREHHFAPRFLLTGNNSEGLFDYIENNDFELFFFLTTLKIDVFMSKG
jgi:hypothetical protein